ncbi:MAG: DUF2470 domain-containing protein [Candidatus Omnitrophica bacterium]|nr:DUF2470 domain-containing protein [Candidatus Omnitrophota bacterium]
MNKTQIAKEARLFLRRNRNGILSTISHSVEEHPYGSVCPYLLDYEGRPIIFVSDIAHHTKNMMINDKVCLTVMDESKKRRLDGSRVSYMGNIVKIQDAELNFIEEQYLKLFPEAKSYYDAHDFQYYRIEPKRIRFIEGFAKIHWIERKDFLLESTNLEDSQEAIIRHMNMDHHEALKKYCAHYYQTSVEEPQLLLIDPDGFIIRNQDEDFYIPFGKLCHNSEDIRKEMIRLSKL